MLKPIVLAAAAASTVASLAPAAEAGHRHHRHSGVSVYIGAPFGVHGPFYGRNYRPVGPFYAGGVYHRAYGYRSEPFCRQWAWVYTRSGKQKWRCLAW